MNMFEVLAEPARRQILDLIRDDERSVGELVQSLSMSQPAVSKHLRVLRSTGFVESRIDGQRRMYHLCPEPLSEIDTWLEPYRRLWQDRLDRLAQHLEATQQTGGGTITRVGAPEAASLLTEPCQEDLQTGLTS